METVLVAKAHLEIELCSEQTLSPCCFLRHITVKSVANAEMTTKGTVMAMALIGPAHGECTWEKKTE